MQESVELALQHLLNNEASLDEIDALRNALSLGQIAIGGNVNHSIIIVGSGNTVTLPEGAIDKLDARGLLGNMERDLNGDEIAVGLNRLANLIQERAPCLQPNLKMLAEKLQPFIKTMAEALSGYSRQERIEALAAINGLCIETLDVSFNALCLGTAPPQYDPRCPFPGLAAFQTKDAEFFFGRNELTQNLRDKLEEHHFLAVLGASGTGKSSLVMAGLVPLLKRATATFCPGTDPLAELGKAQKLDPELIVVDQFEELFTRATPEQQAQFITAILAEGQRRRVVITLRSDFLGEAARFEALRKEIENHQVIIPPMSDAELHLAMGEQAQKVGLRFEADLREQMLENVSGEPGAMPLLQHALWMLWERRHGRWLKADEYRAFGGVKKAIASHANDVYIYKEKNPEENKFEERSEEERERLKHLFLRLTRLDESTDQRDTRQRVQMSELIPVHSEPGSTNQLITELVNKRLLVKTGDEVEVAHDALIRYWDRLKQWLDEDRDEQILLQIVRDDARRWEKGNRDKGLLHHQGNPLKKALEIQKNQKFPLSLVEQEYLDACQQAHNRKILINTAVISTIAILLIALLIIFLIQERPIPGQWAKIPAGMFQMGMTEPEMKLAASLCQEGALDASRCTSLADLPMESGPQKNASLPEYHILDNEVTNAQYQQCITAEGCTPPQDWVYKKANMNEPVTNLNWFQANAYCSWLGGRLPTEGEWEKAARGPNNYSFPWGNAWDATKANLEHTGIGTIKSIQLYASTDISGYLVKNMAGNVNEWTASEALPIEKDQVFSNVVYIPPENGMGLPVIVRGGSWLLARSEGMAAKRGADSDLSKRSSLGFRCVCPEGAICKEPWNWTWIWLGK